MYKYTVYNFAKFLLVAVFVLVVNSNTTYSATSQGSLGSTSTGSVDIAVTSGNQIIIFGLQTVNFGSWSTGDGDLANNQDLCIGKSSFFQPYDILATGDGSVSDPSAFTITNGIDQIHYDVFWNDQTGTTGQVQLLPGSLTLGQTGIPIQFAFNRAFSFLFGGFPCGSPATFFGLPVTPPNANLEIRIPASRLSAALGGSYSGVLTILVMPN